ncbi:MAG: NIPSNAP family protein [Balneolaceae bacterium]
MSKMKRVPVILNAILGVLLLSLLAGWTPGTAESEPQVEEPVYQMRIYTAHEGKFEDLKTRFRDHTIRIFEKHGIESIGYWIPQPPAGDGNTLICIVSYENQAATETSWEAFVNDPEWQQVYEESNADGPIVRQAETFYMNSADFSPLP